MTWFKVDDTLAFHHKTIAAGNAAMGLWVRAGSWSSATLSEGFVPLRILKSLGTERQAEALVKAGLWVDADGGYRFHQWADEGRQPSKEKVEADRAASRERQRKHREEVKSRRDTSDPSRVSHGVTTGEVTPLVTGGVTPTPTRPDPTRPNTTVGGSVHRLTSLEPPPHDDPPTLTETTLDEFGIWCDQHGQPRPPKAVRIGLAGQISSLIAEDIPIADIRRGLIAWQGKTNLGPSALPSVVHEVRSRPAAGNRRQQDTDTQFDRMLAQAAERDAQQKAIPR